MITKEEYIEATKIVSKYKSENILLRGRPKKNIVINKDSLVDIRISDSGVKFLELVSLVSMSFDVSYPLSCRIIQILKEHGVIIQRSTRGKYVFSEKYRLQLLEINITL